MTTMDLNQTTELTYGTDILPEEIGIENLTEPIPTGTAMDQTLPPSRPGTPQLSICKWKRECVELIDNYTSSIEFIKASLRHLQGKKPTDDQSDSHLVHIYNEHEQRLSDYTKLKELTVSEFSSLPNCEIPDCAVHHTPHTSPAKTNVSELPTLLKSTATKRKETDIGFVSPPTRKLSKNLKTNENPEPNFRIDLTNRFNGLENQEPITTPVAGTSTGNASATSTNRNTTTVVPENERKLPLPIFLKITDNYRVQMKIVNNFMPKLRNKMSGEYFKLYCDTHDQFDILNNFLEEQKFEFYSITPKHLRPIKVVIKGLPKDTKTQEIHQDLLDLGFTVDRVSQFTGRITNEPLPVFLITLPRNIDNAKIFKVNKLAFITAIIEGYESKGVTQCYKCQKFNHTASNCHIKPRCLKCGEAHQTAECQIQKVENMYCINCKTYGHMANYSKCPLFPKPRKGKFEKPNYSSIVESIVRPNLTFAQAAKQSRVTTQATVPQQMAPRAGQIPATNQMQTQATRRQIPPNPSR
ncbi:nucleic-acid-binding protein from transposon X-element [Trichonephila clavipes]|uniref:Nucleic-acid-binding protein from transposon X-element n=1 Tax=Trichonephila clavipes TaxID=2585209 RepID=A0A8X6V2H3_TRICX|nr:nucleic-acid-binding protein from transposon X-element [Trichonephila clavipes]